MRRQRRVPQDSDGEDHYLAVSRKPMQNGGIMDEFMQMEYLPNGKMQKHRFENTMEAKVEVGDTLQALALRFNCTVADIKRLNKIDKENEIHAHKVIKIPVTVHSVLLGALPTVHKSGNNSPRGSHGEDECESNIERNPLENARIVLSEKLMVASVNASQNSTSSNANFINQGGNSVTAYTEYDELQTDTSDLTDATKLPLLSDILDDERVAQPRIIPGPRLRSAIDWSGSDCDMSWVCLLVFILALCFVIPLIYVVYLAEHRKH